MEEAEDGRDKRSITQTISALNRSLETPPPAYLSVFRLFEVSSEYYFSEPGSNGNQQMISALSCTLRVGGSKGPVRRRSLAFLQAATAKADLQIITSLCRDLKELLFSKNADQLGVDDRFVVAAALGILMPKCNAAPDEVQNWLASMLEKKQAITEKTAERAVSTAVSICSTHPNAAAMLAFAIAKNASLRRSLAESLTSACVKCIAEASPAHMEIWATVLAEVERSVTSLQIMYMGSGTSHKSSKRSKSKEVWHQLNASKHPQSAFWIGVHFLRQLFRYDEDSFLMYDVVNALGMELVSGNFTLFVLSELLARTVLGARKKVSMLQHIAALTELISVGNESSYVRALATSTLSQVIQTLGVDTLDVMFLEGDVISTALRSLSGDSPLERVGAASLLSSVLSRQVVKRNVLLGNLVDDLRGEALHFASTLENGAVGKAAAISLLAEVAHADDVSTELVESTFNCAVACISNSSSGESISSSSNSQLRLSGWMMMTAAARLRSDVVFDAERLGALARLWQEELLQMVKDSSEKKKSSEENARLSNVHAASLLCLQECLKHCQGAKWFRDAAEALLGATAARLSGMMGDSHFWRDYGLEVLVLLKCIQLLPMDDIAFQSCYSLTFTVVREFKQCSEIRSGTLFSTVHNVASSRFRPSFSGLVASELAFYFMPEHVGINEEEMFGEATEALGALLSRDLEAALTFLISLAEAPSLSPLVDAALSLAIVRRLTVADLASVANAGRINASVQVLLRRSLNSLGAFKKSSQTKELRKSLRSCKAWSPFQLPSVDLATTIALSYQALGEKGGNVLVSGLIDRAQNIIDNNLITDSLVARAVFAIVGTLLNSVPEEETQLTSKIVSLIETALSHEKGQLRLAAAAAINHSSSSIANCGESLLAYLLFTMAQGSVEADPHVSAHDSVLSLSLGGSPEAVIVTAVGTKAVLSACKENSVALEQSTITIAYEIVCEVLLWPYHVAPKARAAGLKSLQLLWEAVIEQEALQDGASRSISLDKFFPADLRRDVAIEALVQALCHSRTGDVEVKDAAAGALMTLILGAGSEAVFDLCSNINFVLFRAFSVGCDNAYTCLEVLVSDLEPKRVASWLSVCEKVFHSSIFHTTSRFSEDDGDDDEDEDDEIAAEIAHANAEEGCEVLGWRCRAAALGIMQTLLLTASHRPACHENLCAALGDMANLARHSISESDAQWSVSVSGARMIEALGYFAANAKDAIDVEKVASSCVRLVEALGAALDSTKSPIFLCTAFCTLQKLLALTLQPSTTFREPDFLAFDLLNLKKYLDACRMKDVWSEVTKAVATLSIVASSAALVSSAIVGDSERSSDLWEGLEPFLEFHKVVYFAVSADMSALLCDGTEVLNSEGGSLTCSGAPPGALEEIYQMYSADIIFAAILLHDTDEEHVRFFEALSPDLVEAIWMNENAPGACLVRTGHPRKDLESFLLSLLGWWLDHGHKIRPRGDGNGLKRRVEMCGKALERILSSWDGCDPVVAKEALTNLDKLDNRVSLELCWFLMNAERLSLFQEEALAICGKSLLFLGSVDPRDRDTVLKKGIEVIFAILQDGVKTDDIQDMTSDARSISDAGPFAQEFEGSAQGLILRLVERAAESEMQATVGWRGFLSVVETTAQVTLERLGSGHSANIELLLTACTKAAETGFHKGNAAGIACTQPVLRMANQMLSDGNLEVCVRLLSCKPFVSLLMKNVRIPSQDSRSLVELLSHVSTCAKQDDASSGPATQLLFDAYVMYNDLEATTKEEATSNRHKQRAFASALAPELLYRFRNGHALAEAARDMLGHMDPEDLSNAGADQREIRAILNRDAELPAE